VGLAVAVIATSTWADVRRPVIEHDDWDMLLPDGAAFVENHQQRVLHEGRWLNYWWWQLGSVHLTPLTATVGFALGWLVVTATLTRVLARGWWAVPIAVALYASPMISQISSWPATTLPPVAVLALGSVGLAVTRERWWRHLAVLLAAVFLLVLGYPPFALLLLPLLVALHAHARWRRLAALGCAVAGAYVAGILTICVLNAVHFGVFGIQIAAWRHPTPLTGVGALLQHLGVMRHDAHVLVATTAVPLAIVVCVVLPLAAAGGQRRLVVLGLAFLLALGLSAAITLLTGVDVPFRSSGWLWSLGVVGGVLDGAGARAPALRERAGSDRGSRRGALRARTGADRLRAEGPARRQRGRHPDGLAAGERPRQGAGHPGGRSMPPLRVPRGVRAAALPRPGGLPPPRADRGPLPGVRRQAPAGRPSDAALGDAPGLRPVGSR
jgi:hypothetical protein